MKRRVLNQMVLMDTDWKDQASEELVSPWAGSNRRQAILSWDIIFYNHTMHD